MSLAEEMLPGPCTEEEVWVRELYKGGLRAGPKCIMGNSHMGTPLEQTDTTENITFPQPLFGR